MLVVKDSSGVIYPADRCTWVESAAAGGGYSIGTAKFYDGATAGGTALTSPELGFIGKSGRFVKISS